VEGAATAEAVLALGEEHHWHLPICHEVVAVMEGRIGAAAAVRRLMERHLKAEELPR
jgi:glycerol-3-phosphate dehydrogenase